MAVSDIAPYLQYSALEFTVHIQSEIYQLYSAVKNSITEWYKN